VIVEKQAAISQTSIQPHAKIGRPPTSTNNRPQFPTIFVFDRLNNLAQPPQARQIII